MPDRIIKWATHGRIKPGVKRIALIAIGVLGLVRGLSYVDPPDVPSGLSTLDQLVPIEYWGWVWVAVGLISVLGAFTSHYRVPFIPFMIISTLWAFSYMTEWAKIFYSTGVDSRDYITAVSYAAQAIMILAIIRLLDPAEVKPRRGGERVD